MRCPSCDIDHDWAPPWTNARCKTFVETEAVIGLIGVLCVPGDALPDVLPDGRRKEDAL